MNLGNDPFGVKPAITFVLVVIPIVSALIDYEDNKNNINRVLREIRYK